MRVVSAAVDDRRGGKPTDPTSAFRELERLLGAIGENSPAVTRYLTG
jgi:hypothetical protein